MHVMRRRTTIALLVACSMIAAASAALEVVGLVREDKLYIDLFNRQVTIASMPHHLWLVFSKARSPEEVWWWFDETAQVSNAKYLEPRAGQISGSFDFFLAIPHWLLFLLNAPWPLWWLARRRKLSIRRRRGLCTQCGYDIRASTDRCPECGEAIQRDTGVSPVQAAPQ
jgi:hypothetical protein